MSRFQTVVSASLLCLGVSFLPGVASAGPELQWDLSYNALYESNIYHSYLDSVAVGSQLNLISGEIAMLVRQTPRLKHQFTIYTELDLYASHTNRNRTAIGVTYEPSYKYAKNSVFSLNADISVRNRDVLSDAGEPLARTLKKAVAEFGADNKFSFGRWRADQAFGYSHHNYEDSYDSLGNRLTSYDYHAWLGEAGLRYRLGSHVKPRVQVGFERRYYSERKTYPVAKGPVRGYGVVRNYTDVSFEGAFEVEFGRRWQLTPEIGYTHRKDNFENFYGYSELKYGLQIEVRPIMRDELHVAVEFRQKDYDNYWTRNIGKLNTISIDYATVEVENRYQLTPAAVLFLFARNFNKVSNEHYYPGISIPSFDYRDFTGGIGVRYKI